MNQRDALRYAARELLDIAQCRAADYGMGEVAIPEGWSPHDVDRVVRGFRTLAARLEYTVTGERAARTDPDDPDQIPLFDKES